MRNNPIHGLKKRAFYEKKWIVECIAAGPPIVGAAWAAYVAYGDPTKSPTFWVLSAVALWLLLALALKILHVRALEAKEDIDKSHEGLLAALNVLHSTVSHAAKLGEERLDFLRVTFHRVVPPLDDSQHIEQIVPYIGGGGTGQGRTFSIRSGITGCAIRENAVFTMDRQSESFDEYVNELVKDWSYTLSDARKMTMDRFSAMAVPVKGRGREVLGVVYLDSKSKNFFASDLIQDAVIGGCSGIAKYIGERYV